MPQLAGPNLPNSLEFSLDAATGKTKSPADFFIHEAIELVLGDLAEAIVVKQNHQALKFFVDYRRILIGSANGIFGPARKLGRRRRRRLKTK